MRKELKELVKIYVEDIKRIIRDLFDRLDEAKEELMIKVEDVDKTCVISEEEFDEFVTELCEIGNKVTAKQVESYEEMRETFDEILDNLGNKEPD